MLKKVQKYIKSSKKVSGVVWEKAPDIDKRIKEITSKIDLEWKSAPKIYSFRSYNSKSKAYARIWGLSRIWQMALDENPSYVVEVLSEKFDKLKENQKNDILIHELAHIPKNVSGSLVPHFRSGKRNFHKRVKSLTNSYKNKK
jgi:predicted metallopeptidase